MKMCNTEYIFSGKKCFFVSLLTNSLYLRFLMQSPYFTELQMQLSIHLRKLQKGVNYINNSLAKFSPSLILRFQQLATTRQTLRIKLIESIDWHTGENLFFLLFFLENQVRRQKTLTDLVQSAKLKHQPKNRLFLWFHKSTKPESCWTIQSHKGSWKKLYFLIQSMVRNQSSLYFLSPDGEITNRYVENEKGNKTNGLKKSVQCYYMQMMWLFTFTNVDELELVIAELLQLV